MTCWKGCVKDGKQLPFTADERECDNVFLWCFACVCVEHHKSTLHTSVNKPKCTEMHDWWRLVRAFPSSSAETNIHTSMPAHTHTHNTGTPPTHPPICTNRCTCMRTYTSTQPLTHTHITPTTNALHPQPRTPTGIHTWTGTLVSAQTSASATCWGSPPVTASSPLSRLSASTQHPPQQGAVRGKNTDQGHLEQYCF